MFSKHFFFFLFTNRSIRVLRFWLVDWFGLFVSCMPILQYTLFVLEEDSVL